MIGNKMPFVSYQANNECVASLEYGKYFPKAFFFRDLAATMQQYDVKKSEELLCMSSQNFCNEMADLPSVRSLETFCIFDSSRHGDAQNKTFHLYGYTALWLLLCTS